MHFLKKRKYKKKIFRGLIGTDVERVVWGKSVYFGGVQAVGSPVFFFFFFLETNLMHLLIKRQYNKYIFRELIGTILSFMVILFLHWS